MNPPESHLTNLNPPSPFYHISLWCIFSLLAKSNRFNLFNCKCVPEGLWLGGIDRYYSVIYLYIIYLYIIYLSLVFAIMYVDRLYYLWISVQDSKGPLQSICYKKRVLSLVGSLIVIFWAWLCLQVNHGMLFCLYINPVCECRFHTGCHLSRQVVSNYKKRKKSPETKYGTNYSALQLKKNDWLKTTNRMGKDICKS